MVAPKILTELTSIFEVYVVKLNLSRFLDAESSSLLSCFDVLISDQHNKKIQTVCLDGVSISSIFDAETFCKRFFNKLTNVERLEIKKCQPMLIEKFFMSLST